MTPMFSTALLRTQSDERLVALAGEGQERAFEVIVDRYRKPLQRYCERALSRSRAEDVVQQVLMKAWLALRGGTEIRSLKPWLYTVARTTALDDAQSPGYDYRELALSLRAPDDSESEAEQRAVIRNTLTGLAALPEPQREALLRAAFEGQSRQQIAEALGISEGAVRQLLHRARANLRAAATAVTPFPVANWLAAIGQSPVGGAAIENGAVGSIGIATVAKAGAILAAAGAIAAGPAGVRDGTIDGANKAQARPSKATAVYRKIRHVVAARPSRLVSEVSPVRVTRPQARQSSSHEAQAQQRDDHKSQGGNGERGGQSRGSGEGDSGNQQKSQDTSSGNDHAQNPPAPPEGDTTAPPPPDESPPPPPGDSGGSGSGGSGD
jgi:RNA polymerase sigma factor (sigma-70 family)